MKKVLVCGSRTFSKYWVVQRVLDELLAEGRLDVLVHGTGKGADSLADVWAEVNDIDMLKYAPDWETHGKAAGPIRNRKMLNISRPDLVVAFVDKPLAESKGTANMVMQAENANVPVHLYIIPS